MENFLFGLVGLLAGFLLNLLKEAFLHRQKSKREAEYLVVNLSSLLDRFASACLDVSNDNGFYMGELDKEGRATIQVPSPTLQPELLKVEWKSIPVSLMYRALTLPSKIDQAEAYANATYEHDGHPPFYESFFIERQHLYSKLGIEASLLASDLRQYVGLPEQPESIVDIRIIDYLRCKLASIEQRKKRATLPTNILLNT